MLPLVTLMTSVAGQRAIQIGGAMLLGMAVDDMGQIIDTESLEPVTIDDLQRAVSGMIGSELPSEEDEAISMIEGVINSLMDEIDALGVEITAELAQEAREVVEGEFSLRFGEFSFNTANERVDHRYRAPKDALAALVNGVQTTEPVAHPVMIDGVPFHYDSGLTVIIADSKKGKTTLLRNLARELLARKGAQDVTVGFIPWNERDPYAGTGSIGDLVNLIDKTSAAADVVMIDSLREFIVGGKSPGYRGLSTSFVLNLTDWHHAMIERNVSCIAVINPIIGDDNFTDAIVEILEGSIGGYMILTEAGQGLYTHVRNERETRKISIPKEFPNLNVQDPDNNETINFNSVDLDETKFRKNIEYLRP